jgi:hypothetical protein
MSIADSCNQSSVYEEVFPLLYSYFLLEEICSSLDLILSKCTEVAEFLMCCYNLFNTVIHRT